MTTKSAHTTIPNTKDNILFILLANPAVVGGKGVLESFPAQHTNNHDKTHMSSMSKISRKNLRNQRSSIYSTSFTYQPMYLPRML